MYKIFNKCKHWYSYVKIVLYNPISCIISLFFTTYTYIHQILLIILVLALITSFSIYFFLIKKKTLIKTFKKIFNALKNRLKQKKKAWFYIIKTIFFSAICLLLVLSITNDKTHYKKHTLTFNQRITLLYCNRINRQIQIKSTMYLLNI